MEKEIQQYISGNDPGDENDFTKDKIRLEIEKDVKEKIAARCRAPGEPDCD